MRVGVWFDFRNPRRWRRSWQRLYAETLEEIQLAESLGYDSVWFSEHHFTDEGYLPSLPVALAAAAARTTRVRLGTAVVLAPLHHPLRLAEDLAVVDQLADGRLEVGLAPGYRPSEFAQLGVPHGERGARTDETIELLRLAWRSGVEGTPFSYAGRHHRFEQVVVAPPPLQLPAPPLWVGGSSRASALRAARYGCNYMPDSGAPVEVYDLYRSALGEHGFDAGTLRTMTNRVIYVCEDPEAGWNDVKEHYLHVFNVYREWFAEAGDFAELGPPLTDADQLPRDVHVVGTPAMVVQWLQELRQRVPFDDLLFWARPPGLSLEKAARSLELFARHVMPAMVGSQSSVSRT